ncbi:DUF3084 domain-containing protein [Geitlerinema sp. PCC 9228]|jgi:uncharacterized protein (DUF3084 family)|uniref:DUF3084 domain-containing protein n=1 Tax=Geitlerinema sp. PCC 9228 TaxID=111611 RepID=UPI0008F9AD61|nr:DUF3084 domain-containing protein [Geitlerinema sp. PCC 9228]
MNAGYVLIVAILLLGGAIATVGDRLGTKVGKARLRLYGLRPKQTATVITIITGSVISASTLGILLASDRQLRTGIFKLEEIQEDLEDAKNDLTQTRQTLHATTTQLDGAKQELAQVKRLLRDNQNQLQQARLALERVRSEKRKLEANLEQTRSQLSQVETNLQNTQAQLQEVSQQKNSLQQQIQQLQARSQELLQERETLLAQKEAAIAKRDKIIEQREQKLAKQAEIIRAREDLLAELQRERTFLEAEVRQLEQESQKLREGNVALLRGEVLASGAVRVVDTEGVPEAIDRLLREANREAIRQLLPGREDFDFRAVRISQSEVQQLLEQIEANRVYVMRIISAENYLVGEKNVEVVADVVPNRLLLLKGDLIAATSVNPMAQTSEEIRDRISLLIEASQFRARWLGLLSPDVKIGDDDIDDISKLANFLKKVESYNQPLKIKAVAAEAIYTVGPLTVNLLAVNNQDEVIARTN